jgi:hypothetical protein
MISAVVDLSGLNPLLPFMVVLNEGLNEAVLKEGGVDDGGTNDVGIHVGCGSSIFNVTLLLSRCGGGDPYGASTIACAIREDFFVGGLVMASKSLIVVSVQADVKLVLGSHSLEESLNVVHASDLSHGLGGEVGVAASSVPVLEELRLKGDGDAKVFSDSAEEVSGYPDLITDLNTKARTNLELPLAWHNLTVSSGDLDASEEASFVVGIDDGATIADVGTN